VADPNPPNAAPQFRERRRHHRKPGDRALWQIGVMAAPPAATLGLAIAIIDFVSPSLGILPLLRYIGFLMAGICAISLVLILYNIRPSSSRLKLPKLWLAVVLSVIAVGAIWFADHRAQQKAGAYVPPDFGPVYQGGGQ